ncbi:helix-turn-helix domain-containing protein [Streptomyces luteogriseus]|uniref:helix-turn-helix domain-containing protein n=1 Tax=Streptomyces luteogriseus TaxID=68233 RepID=UPI00382C50FA
MRRDLPDDHDEWLVSERRRIGDRIRSVRMDRNLTQEAVFLAVPLTRSFYQEIEAGRANPSLDTLLRIARVIRVPIGDLLR